jgi:hypothetical protein
MYSGKYERNFLLKFNLIWILCAAIISKYVSSDYMVVYMKTMASWDLRSFSPAQADHISERTFFELKTGL